MQKENNDLLKFQKNLNEQFLEIFDNNTKELTKGSDSLGLSIVMSNLNIFLNLENLQTIVTKLNYENTIRTKSWILGFNQEHGKVYTIFNLNKVLELIIDNKSDYNIEKLKQNSNIVYLKNELEYNYGFLVNDFKMDYTAEFTLIYKKEKKTDEYYWEINKDVNFENLIKKEDMSEENFDFLAKINNLYKSKKIIKNDIYPEYNPKDKYNLLSLVVDKVYFDDLSKKPILILDIISLIKFLINLNPV